MRRKDLRKEIVQLDYPSKLTQQEGKTSSLVAKGLGRKRSGLSFYICQGFSSVAQSDSLCFRPGSSFLFDVCEFLWLAGDNGLMPSVLLYRKGLLILQHVLDKWAVPGGTQVSFIFLVLSVEN